MSSSHSNFSIASTTVADDSQSSSSSSSHYSVSQGLASSSSSSYPLGGLAREMELEEKDVSDAKEEDHASFVPDTLSTVPMLASLALATLIKNTGSLARAKQTLQESNIDIITDNESYVESNDLSVAESKAESKTPSVASSAVATQVKATLFHRQTINLSASFPRYQLNQLPSTLKSIAKKLLNHAIRGERDQIADILNANLTHLPILLRVSGKVTALAKGLAGEKVEHEGTMYQLALHEGDVSFCETDPNARLNKRDERCGLRVMQTAPRSVADLPHNKNCAYVLVQPVAGQEPTALYFIDKRERDADKKIKRINFFEPNARNNLLAQLFQSFHANHYYADIAELSPSELTAITLHTGHSHEEGLCNMLMRYARILQDGEMELAHQFDQQIENTRDQVAAKLAAGYAAIDEFFQALKNANGNDQASVLQSCADAFTAFKTYFIPQGVQRRGRNLYGEWIVYADELRMKFFAEFGNEWNSPKNLITWQKVVGYLQRFVSACDGMAYAQGPLLPC